jgi:fructose/tagatose bisphosphate aldolase
LHGGSGIPQELVLASFKNGITKINIATAIRQPYEATLRETGEEAAAQDAVYTKTSWLIREYFGFDGLRSKITKEAL